MKLIKAILTGVFLVSLVSCQQIIDNTLDIGYKDKYRTKIYDYDFSEICIKQQIAFWIHSYVEYRDEPTEHVDSLEQTINQGYGDCEEIALLYLNILYVRFGIKGSLCICEDTDGRQVVNGGNINHVAIMLDGVLIEPQTGKPTNDKIGFMYSFDEIFYR